MGEQYFKGVLAGYLGANFMCGPITEWQIDIIKENISHYCEATIDHSQLSYQEKEDQKRQMKQSLEVYCPTLTLQNYHHQAEFNLERIRRQ